jgi:flagellar motor component MotA
VTSKQKKDLASHLFTALIATFLAVVVVYLIFCAPPFR